MTVVRTIFFPKFLPRCMSLTVVLLSLTSCIEADTSLISVQDRTKIGNLLFVFDKKTAKIQANLTFINNSEYLLRDDKSQSLLSFRYVRASKDRQFYLVQEDRQQRSNLEKTITEASKALHRFQIMPLIIDNRNNLTIGSIQCDLNALESSKKNNIDLECSPKLFAETAIAGAPNHDSLDCFFYDLFEGNSIKWDEAGTALTGYKIPEVDG